MSTPLRVLVVDDHAQIRQGVKRTLETTGRYAVRAEASSAEEAVRSAEQKQFDVAVVDISLGESSNGLELIRILKAKQPGLRILIMSQHDEMLYAERALLAGAMGYLHKAEAASRLVEALDLVSKKQLFLSDRMKELIVLRRFRQVTESDLPESSLSDRELQVYELIGEGMTSQEIAVALALNEKTVTTHKSSIREKLDLPNSEQLIRRAVLWVLGESNRTGRA